MTAWAMSAVCGLSAVTGVPYCRDCHENKTVNAAALVTETATEQTETVPQFANAPQLTAKAAFLLEANSGKILYAQNADQIGRAHV